MGADSGPATSDDPPFPEAGPEGVGQGPRPAMQERAEGRGPLIVLAYLWVFCLVPLAIEKRDPDVRWHARHGLVLLVAEIVAALAFSFVCALVGFGSPNALAHLLLLDPWVSLLLVWLHVVATWEALHGRRLRVPAISHYADFGTGAWR